MSEARRGPFRAGVFELLTGANQEVLAPLLLAPRGRFAAAALGLLLAGALALALLPWVPLQVEARGRLVEGEGGHLRFLGSTPLPARPGAPVRLEATEGGVRVVIAGRVVRIDGPAVEVEVEEGHDVGPGARSAAVVCRVTMGRASPLALLSGR